MAGPHRRPAEGDGLGAAADPRLIRRRRHDLRAHAITTVVKNHALDFIDRSRTDGRPWFAYVATRSAHEVNAPERK
ncbi:hypothetical protein [Streptomyces sp. RG80]|uniref:hypothetical protein n=1 Tax=Streptomyces sp. RG80 TaxID=3157340 RepID=UPI0033904A3D